MTRSTLDLIGGTEAIELSRVRPGRGRVVAKAEYLNPGGSIKDRAALRIIRDAKARGELRDGQPVVEMTSGNMGAGLAVVCAVLGHPFIATMSAGNSAERGRMMQGLGATVEYVPQVDGAAGQVTGSDIAAAVARARAMADERGAFYVDQFNRAEGIDAHHDTTGQEILQQVDNVQGFVACVGTGATFCGVARRLKEHDAAVTCIAVEPAGAECLAGKAVTKPRHSIQGTGYGLVPPHWDASVVDGCDAVTDEEATAMTLRLGREEGLYVGTSSGANVVAALRLAERIDATVVTVLCDSGMKYSLSPRD